MAQASHIPAWKRLGLKLKYAQEDTPESGPDSATSNGSRKTKAHGTNGIIKSKNGNLNGHSPPPSSNGSVPHINGHSDGPPPAKKQKRVSFSADTKLLDGDGDGPSTARHAIPSELANASSSLDVNTGSNSSKPAAISKPKPTKKSKSSPTPPSKHKSQNMLDYLHQYYNEHSSWKFQKNREVWILKHALSTEDIPTKGYGLALAQYVHGLKSEGSRKRLTEEAQGKLSLTSTIETGSEQENSTEHQAEQLKRLKEMLASFPDKITLLSDNDEEEEESHHYHHHHTVLATLSRPMLILTALHPDSDGYPTAAAENGEETKKKTQQPGTDSDSPLLPKPASSAETARNKKRKNRTTVVDYSSSSSSESENESSSSESESETESENDNDTHNGHDGHDDDDDDDDDDETSSESSSDSDSDSDSDSS